MIEENRYLLQLLAEKGLLTEKQISSIGSSLRDNSTLEDCAQLALDILAEHIETKSDGDALLSLIKNLCVETINNYKEKTTVKNEDTNLQTQISKPIGEFDISEITKLEKQKVKDVIRNSLLKARSFGASDFHVSALSQAFIRKNLLVERISDKIISPEESEIFNTALLTDDQLEFFKKNNTITKSIEFSENERYRMTLLLHKDGISGSYHVIPDRIAQLSDLGFDKLKAETINTLLSYHNGLILITGPFGGGKTTTLAAMIDILNKTRKDHIITVENPIEIIQHSSSCNVTQREIGKHTQSYAKAIKAALREDPDIIVIGELKDLETIEIAISASETGHLVIGTMQTRNAINTLNRLINVFPPFQQHQIKIMLAGSLRGVICQQLIPNKRGKLSLATEIMINTTAISNNIVEGKTHLFKQTIQTASKQGMIGMDECVFGLYQSGEISGETAKMYITDIENYKSRIQEYTQVS